MIDLWADQSRDQEVAHELVDIQALAAKITADVGVVNLDPLHR